MSKVGKAIDRSFVADYDSTSRDEVFASPQTQAMVNEVILQVKKQKGSSIITRHVILDNF